MLGVIPNQVRGVVDALGNFTHFPGEPAVLSSCKERTVIYMGHPLLDCDTLEQFVLSADVYCLER